MNKTKQAAGVALLLALLCACSAGQTESVTPAPLAEETAVEEPRDTTEQEEEDPAAEQPATQEATTGAEWELHDLRMLTHDMPVCEVPGGFVTLVREPKPRAEGSHVDYYEGQLWFTGYATRRQQKVEHGPFDVELYPDDYGGSALFYAGGLVWAVTEAQLYSMNPDGSDVRLVYSIWPSETESRDVRIYWGETFFTDGVNFYARVHYYRGNNVGSGEMIQVHLPTGEVTVLFEDNINSALVGCEGPNMLVLRRGIDDYIYAFNTQTGEDATYTHERGSRFAELTTGRPSEMHLPLFTEHNTVEVGGGYQGLWYFSLEDEDWLTVPGTSYETYAFLFDDTETGSLLLAQGMGNYFYTSLHGEGRGTWSLLRPSAEEYIDEEEIVKPTAALGAYYLIPDIGRSALGGSLILKEDFWNSTPNYLPITVVEE